MSHLLHIRGCAVASNGASLAADETSPTANPAAIQFLVKRPHDIAYPPSETRRTVAPAGGCVAAPRDRRRHATGREPYTTGGLNPTRHLGDISPSPLDPLVPGGSPLRQVRRRRRSVGRGVGGLIHRYAVGETPSADSGRCVQATVRACLDRQSLHPRATRFDQHG